MLYVSHSLDFSCFLSVVPHVTDAIQEWVERVAAQPVDKSGCNPDVCLIEVCCVLLARSNSKYFRVFLFLYFSKSLRGLFASQCT